MTSLATKIKLYCEENSKVADFTPDSGNVMVVSDGTTETILKWDIDGLDKPTKTKLNTYNTNATKEENNNVIRETRKNLYGNVGDQLDEIFKDIDSWKTRIQKIKDDNPKE